MDSGRTTQSAFQSACERKHGSCAIPLIETGANVNVPQVKRQQLCRWQFMKGGIDLQRI